MTQGKPFDRLRANGLSPSLISPSRGGKLRPNPLVSPFAKGGTSEGTGVLCPYMVGAGAPTYPRDLDSCSRQE